MDVTPVITHHFAIADYEEAFALAASGESGKIILEWPAALGGGGPESHRDGGLL